MCEQEGLGPCLFCGSRIRERTALHDQLNTMARAGDAEATRLAAETVRALERKDRLLEYDRTAAKRTTVIDDMTDYYSADTNQWLTDEERRRLKQRQEEVETHSVMCMCVSSDMSCRCASGERRHGRRCK